MSQSRHSSSDGLVSSAATSQRTQSSSVQEIGSHKNEELFRRHHVILKTQNKLGWDTESPHFPRNWSLASKCYTTAIVSWLELYMTAISSSGTASAESARYEFGISKTLAYFAFLSVCVALTAAYSWTIYPQDSYLIAQTLGGIICSPLSEYFGRRSIYIIGSLVFLVGSIITAEPHSLVAVFFGRILCGVAAAIPATVAYGTMQDLWDAHMRIWVVFWYTIAGISGLTMGPIFSTYVTQYAGWRVVYYISTGVSGTSAIASAFTKESNAEQLLEERVRAVNRELGSDVYVTEGAHEKPTLGQFAKTSLWRPLQFLLMEPVVFFCAILCAIAFGLAYGLTESLSIVYMSPPFSFTQTSASLAFVPLLIGEMTNILPRFYDDHVFMQYKAQRKRLLPETKLTSFAIACPALAIGLWIFAWTIPPRVTDAPWPISMIGLICVGFAINDFSYTLFGYATDCYGPYAASAVSAVSLARTLTASVFPLFTTQMYNGLGSNVATTILASVATAFCVTPFLFSRLGGTLRRISDAACSDEDALTEENAHLEKEEDEKALYTSRAIPRFDVRS